MEPEGGDSMKLGENIRALRLRKRLPQEQVAQQLGVTYQAVSKWENGTNTPDIALLPEIAAFFGVTIDALFHQDAISALDGFPVEDDGVIRIVQLRGRQVLKVTPRMSPDDPAIEIAFPAAATTARSISRSRCTGMSSRMVPSMGMWLPISLCSARKSTVMCAARGM